MKLAGTARAVCPSPPCTSEFLRIFMASALEKDIFAQLANMPAAD
jgi:hypothetical protein